MLLYCFAIIQIPHNANVGKNRGHELLPNLTKKGPAKFGLTRASFGSSVTFTLILLLSLL